MRNLFLFTCLFCFINGIPGQNYAWTKTFGGNSFDEGFAIASDANGNVFVSGGYWYSNIDLDPGTGMNFHPNRGGQDVFLQKFDGSGNLIWAISFGGPVDDWVHSIALDLFGNIFLVGQFESTVDFDPGPGIFNLTSSGPTFDIFILKLDPQGNFIWAKSIGNSNSGDGGYSVLTDNIGNVFIGGFFSDSVDFNPGGPANFHTSNGLADIFLLKLDSIGIFQWVKTFGGTGDDWVVNQTIGVDGSIYLTGFYESLTDFNPGIGVENHACNGQRDVFVEKIDNSGSFVWVATFGGPGGDEGQSITIDGIGNLFISGHFEDTIDFDPGISNEIRVSNGLTDNFILILDNNGSFQWAKSFGGVSTSEFGTSISMGLSGNLLITGPFSGTVDLDPGSGIQNFNSFGAYGMDTYVLSLDRFGNYLWAKTFGGNNICWPNSIISDAFGDIIITGRFAQTVDFNPDVGIDNHTGLGPWDAFVWKYAFSSVLDENKLHLTASVVLQEGVLLECTRFSQSELNSIVFQRSRDGSNWDELKISSPMIVSLPEISFKILDKDPFKGISFYRLMLIDRSGNQSYSNVESVNISSHSNFVIYPCPASKEMTIIVEEKFFNSIVELINTSGEKVIYTQIENEDKKIIDLDIPSGVYFISITNRFGEKVVRKIVRE